MDDSNPVAFVTGAGSGIGAATATLLAARGWAVAAVDLKEEAAARTATAIMSAGGSAVGLAADVRSRKDLDAAVAETEKVWGPITTVIANAGVAAYPSKADETDEDAFDTMFDVNVKGAWHTVRAALPSLRRAGGGSIVLTGSIMGVRPRPGHGVYAASKAAVNSLARSLALDLAADAIRVNAVAPTATDSAMLPLFLGGDEPDAARQAFVASIPLGRLVSVDDVAASIAFLSSSEAAMLTGVVLPVDGGRAV